MHSRVFAALLPLLFSACLAGPDVSLAPTLEPPPGNSPTPTAPSATVVATSGSHPPTPSLEVSASPAEPTPTATDDDPPGDGPPPLANLRLAEGTEVAGKLGSWCYGRSCSDTPAYPLDRLPKLRLAHAGGWLTIILPEGASFTYWRASYTESIAVDSYGITLGSGGDLEEPSAEFETASFAGPPAGSWGLMLTLLFADPDGDAFYSWHAIVAD